MASRFWRTVPCSAGSRPGPGRSSAASDPTRCSGQRNPGARRWRRRGPTGGGATLRSGGRAEAVAVARVAGDELAAEIVAALGADAVARPDLRQGDAWNSKSVKAVPLWQRRARTRRGTSFARTSVARGHAPNRHRAGSGPTANGLIVGRKSRSPPSAPRRVGEGEPRRTSAGKGAAKSWRYSGTPPKRATSAPARPVAHGRPGWPRTRCPASARISEREE